MIPKNIAYVRKYNIEAILDALTPIPGQLHGFTIDPDTLVDIFILQTLNSFEVCEFLPSSPAINDPVVLKWIGENDRAKSILWQLIRTPPQFAGCQVPYIRLGPNVWLHYIINGMNGS